MHLWLYLHLAPGPSGAEVLICRSNCQLLKKGPLFIALELAVVFIDDEPDRLYLLGATGEPVVAQALGLELECRGFDIEAEITAKLVRSGVTINELPISYSARYEDKKLSPLDGLPTVRALWKYQRWKPSRTRKQAL